MRDADGLEARRVASWFVGVQDFCELSLSSLDVSFDAARVESESSVVTFVALPVHLRAGNSGVSFDAARAEFESSVVPFVVLPVDCRVGNSGMHDSWVWA